MNWLALLDRSLIIQMLTFRTWSPLVVAKKNLGLFGLRGDPVFPSVRAGRSLEEFWIAGFDCLGLKNPLRGPRWSR